MENIKLLYLYDIFNDLPQSALLEFVSFLEFTDVVALCNSNKKIKVALLSKNIIKLYVRCGYITEKSRKFYYKYMINYKELENTIVNELSHYTIEKNQNVYKTILLLCQHELSTNPSSSFSKSTEEISRDLDRTFSTEHFAKGEGKIQLKNVLSALSFIRPEIGYCQGMNYIAGAFIHFFNDDECSFWIFLYLIDNCELSSLYLKNMPDYQIRLYQLNYFLDKYLSPLYQHFSTHQIDLDIFFSKWIITLFASYLPFSTLDKVLDVFLIDKWKSVFKFSIAFLTFIYEKIINMDLNAMTKYIREHSYNLHADFEKIKITYLKLKITNKRIRELKEDFFMEEVRKKVQVNIIYI